MYFSTKHTGLFVILLLAFFSERHRNLIYIQYLSFIVTNIFCVPKMSHALFYYVITTIKGAMDMMNVKHIIKRDNNGRVTNEIFTNKACDCIEIEYQYDSEGNLVERKASKSWHNSVKSTYAYDFKNRLISEVIERFDDDKLLSSCKIIYIYNTDGNLCQKMEVNNKSRGGVRTEYSYSTDGKILKKEIIFAAGNNQTYVYIYNDDGLMVGCKHMYKFSDYADTETEYFYDSDRNVVRKIETDTENNHTVSDMVYEKGFLKNKVVSYSDTMFKRQFNYDYDSKGRKIKQEYINQYDELITTQFVYDEFGNEIFSFVYDNEYRLIEKNVSDFYTKTWRFAANNGKLTEQRTSYYNGEYMFFKYDYDSNGNEIKEIVRWCNGDTSSKKSFYDENNNLIKRIITKEDGRNVIRQYEYNSENILTEESLTDCKGKTVIWKYSYNSNGDAIVEIDNSENANYDIDVYGELFPKWD